MLLLELTKRLQNSDPQVRYVLTYLYEMFNEQQKQLNMLSNIAKMLAEHDEHIIGQLSLSKTADIGNDIVDAMRQFDAFSNTPGVEVSSVAPDPDKEEKD